MRYYSVNYKGDSEDFRPAVKELMGFMSTCQPALQGMNEYIVKNIKKIPAAAPWQSTGIFLVSTPLSELVCLVHLSPHLPDVLV